jgi:hypothetical protein
MTDLSIDTDPEQTAAVMDAIWLSIVADVLARLKRARVVDLEAAR